jgi:uncharacterized protein (TIGR03437 family)
MRLALHLVASASAYAAGLTATPPVVSWTYVYGSHSYPSQIISLVSSTGAPGYSATANSENGWLLVNAAYVSSSANLSLGAYLIPATPIDRLNAGSYQGVINFTDSHGNTTSVTVNLTITGGGPNPGITATPASLNFVSAFNGPSQTQNVVITGPTAGTLQAQAPSSPGWLQAIVTGAAGQYILVVTVTPGTLGAGTYRENLQLSIGASTATLPVILTVQQQSQLTATPASLSFDYTPGGPPPAESLIQVRSTGGSIRFGASANVTIGNWLRVVGAGFTPNTVLVTPQVDGLEPGFYSGNVLITPEQGAPLIIPVSLTLRPTPVIGVSAGSVSFSYRTGDELPPPLSVQVTGSGASPTFTVQVTGGDWLTATPARPAAPSSLTIAMQPSARLLAPGNYNAQVTVSGSGTAKGSVVIAVSLQVLPKAAAGVTLAKVVNAAGYQEGGISPGEMVTIFGSGLAPAGLATLTLDPNGRVAVALNGVQVLFNGAPGPMIFTTPDQVAAVAPYELDGRSQTTVQVIVNGQGSNILTLPVVASAPAIFTADASGSGPAAATSAPARGVLTLYLTGEGQTSPAGVTGKVTTVSATPPLTPAPVLPLSVMIGALPANYTFAGEAPDIVSGVLQLNVSVPAGLGPGVHPVVVTIGGKTTQSGVTVTVR